MLRKSRPAKIVVATPVSSRQACNTLSQEADACLCLHIPPLFTGVGAYYEDFSEVTDEEVKRYMQMAATA
jgi:predicted phosphoribosyltransferase